MSRAIFTAIAIALLPGALPVTIGVLAYRAWARWRLRHERTAWLQRIAERKRREAEAEEEVEAAPW